MSNEYGKWIETGSYISTKNGTDSDGLNLESFKNAVLKDTSNLGHGLSDFISNKLVKTNDHISILAGTKTLLGNNFSSLYESSEPGKFSSSDGNTYDTIDSTSPYDTEMHSSNCTYTDNTSYSLLSDEQKAIYEITLLSKQYANKSNGDIPLDTIAQQYAETMNQYKSYCDNNDISWDNVCYKVSAELQSECADYKSDNKQIVSAYSASSLGSNCSVANKAHSLLLFCVSTDFKDTLSADALAKCSTLTYDDTLDTSGECTTLLKRVGNCFSKASQTLKDNAPHPIKGLATMFCNVTADLDNICESAQEKTDESNAKTDESVDASSNVLDSDSDSCLIDTVYPEDSENSEEMQ